MTKLNLRVGDKVFVKSEAQILDTLDDQACTNGMVFMPEMRQFCGKAFRIGKSAHKTCDSINNSGGLRLLGTAYHLEGLRCDGSGHGGCEAGCTYFWMEEWLSLEAPAQIESAQADDALSQRVDQNTRQPESEEGEIRYRCQATNLLRATEPMPVYSVGQYVKDVRSGNHSLANITRILTFTAFQWVLRFGVGHRFLLKAYNSFQSIRGGKPYPMYQGQIPPGERTPTAHLDLEPGETVRILPIEELKKTLSTGSRNRGMWFDPEMVKYCDKEYTVQSRVNRIINEQTGVMMEMKNPCILLEDVYCRAECTRGRRGCPRAVNTYWREVWLERVETPAARSDIQA